MPNSAVIIGCGRMGREHAEAYRELGVAIMGVCDFDNDRAMNIIQGDHPVIDDWRDLINRNPESIVSVCSWDDAHAEQIIYALERQHRGVAEKPLCLNYGDLEKINAIAGGRLTCNLPLRNHVSPAVQKPYHIECDYLWGRADQLTGWRKDIADYSFILGGGVHMTDAAMRIMGQRAMFVSAVAQTTDNFHAPTMISAIGTFEDGKTFRIDINCAYTGNHQYRICQWGKHGKFEVTGWASDKRACIYTAIQYPNRAAIAGIGAHAMCFAIERSLANGGRMEQVIYPCE